ncbi:lipopolysaccharide heptosyltransferase II [Anaeromyxobacter sp. K]|uniref:Lipopolysaccharide heptosyltransferase II n=1 Tax=Anaeromyxobacter dehalogenans (strain ATCC BAA-258 / DSM 21875 / 2CP-1) TaxID=455488 RepID=B8JE67_ANAD2|nr:MULTISPECIES: glycosyltransferase family 9 protein [Anaeromyxobacter]ACG73925.1 lipopolysaccharide heptosyltransferase II [Anaeromyxobacter sp. K]ACL66132.1 lipopolysaccharide heptosyltransferase II [Anaeromyxobacter dehalogenans 2CP-1]
MSDPSSILVIRYSAMGDVVLATSVLEPLRARFPGARIEWVTDALYAPLLEGLPGLAAVHRLSREGPSSALPLAARLRGRFDLVIDLQNKVRSAVVARAAAPLRTAFKRRSALRALLSVFGSDPPLVRAHQTQLYGEALAALGVSGPGPLEISLSPQARALAADALQGVEAPAVALAPGARWATKRWPAERFAAVADALHAEGVRIVLCGGPGDRDAFAAFRAATRAKVAADLSFLPLDALAAAIARVQLLIACDSGPVHLATAVGTPVLALFGPTSVARWGPPPPGRALSLGLSCSPCSNHGGDYCPEGHHRCLADLAPQAVLASAREMLRR